MTDNEVSIKVTGQNTSQPAVDGARRGMKGLKDEAGETSVKVRVLGESVKSTTRSTDDLGDKARTTTRELSALDRKILELRASTLALGKQFEATGDSSLLKKFRADSRELAGLERFQKQMTSLGEGGGVRRVKKDVTELAEETSRWGRTLAGVSGTFSQVFQGGVINFLKTPVGATLGGTAAAGTAIGVGAIAGGAVTAGIGAGVAGAGIAGAAMQSKAVQEEWAKTLSVIKKDFLDATSGYEGPAIAAIKRVGGALHNDVDLKGIFVQGEKFVEPIADSVAKALVSIGKGFESLVSHAEPAVVALSNGIQDLGDATGVALDQIGDGSEGGAKALGDFLGVAGDLIMLTGAWIGFFEDSYDAITDMTDGLRELHPFIGLVADGIDDLTGNGKVSQLSGELEHSAEAARGAFGDFEDLSAGMYNTADAADELDQKFRSLFDVMMTQDEANLRVKEGWIKLNKELRDGKRTLDDNTEAGQQNVAAILDQIKMLDGKREADIAAGNGTVEATDTANKAYAGQIETLRLVLIQMGFNKQMVDELIAKYSEIPGEINTNINTYHNDYYARQGAGGSAFDPGARDERRGLATGGVVGAASGMVLSGMVDVAERGREIALLAPGRAVLPPGSQVIPNGTTENMLSRGGQGGAISVVLETTGGGGGDALVEVINTLINGNRLRLKVINNRVVAA